MTADQALHILSVAGYFQDKKVRNFLWGYEIKNTLQKEQCVYHRLNMHPARANQTTCGLQTLSLVLNWVSCANAKS